MSDIILHDSNATTFATQGFGVLSDAIRCEVTEELNGQYELELDYPIDGIHYTDIALRRLIVCDIGRADIGFTDLRQAFRIYKISEPLFGMVTIYARHISYDLSFYVVNPFTATSAADACSKFLSEVVGSCPFSFYCHISVNGTMEVKNPSSIRSLMGGEENSILSVYGGEWHFSNFQCGLWAQRGENRGVTLRYGKNLTQLDREDDDSGQYTNVIGYFTYTEDVNGESVDRVVIGSSVPTGSFNYVKTLSLDVTSDMNNEHRDQSEEGSNDWHPSVSEIDTYVQSYINQNGLNRFATSITLDFVQLEDVKEHIELGDTIKVYGFMHRKEFTARCQKIVWDVLRERYSSMDIGDVKESFSSAMTMSTGRAVLNSVTEGLSNGTFDRIIANSGYFKELFSEYAKISYLEANYIDADTIETDYLHASFADVDNLRASVINAGFITSDTIQSTYATITNLDAANANISTLQTNYVSVSGRLDAAEGNITSLQATDLEVSGRLTAAEGSITSLQATDVSISGRLTAAEGNIVTLNTNFATISDDLEANYITANEIQSNYISSDNGRITYGTIDNLSSSVANINTVLADKISVQDLDAAVANVGYLKTANLDAAVANAGYLKTANLDAAVANVGYLKTANLEAAALAADFITATTIDSTYARTTLANASNSWIENGTIRNAAITNAMIASVSANKLTAGTIDAAKINVTNLRASNLIVDKINGQPVLGGYELVDPTSAGYSEKNPVTEGWYEYVNGNYVLSEDTSVNANKFYYVSSQNSVALYDQDYIDDFEDSTQITLDDHSSRITSVTEDLEGFMQTVSETFDDYSTTVQMYSAIEQSSNSIEMTVARGYAKKDTVPYVNVLPTVYFDENSHGKVWEDEDNGITWTVNSDGSVTATGTATGIARFLFTHCELENPVPTVTLDPDKCYILHGCPANGSVDNTYWLGCRLYDSNEDPDGTYGVIGYDDGDGFEIQNGFYEVSKNIEDYSSKDPAEEGWYEYVNGNYILSIDTEVDETKTYFEHKNSFKYICAYAQIKSGYVCPEGGITFYPMLEAGDVAHNYISSHEGTGALTDRMGAAEASIKVNADSIELKVSDSDITGDYVVGRINLDSTTATIQASHVNLTGAVTVSNLAPEVRAELVETSPLIYYRSTSSTPPVLPSYIVVDSASAGYSDKKPKQEGWYEYTGGNYVLSSDTAVNLEKSYYTRNNITISSSDDVDNTWTKSMPIPKNGSYFFTCEQYTHSDGTHTYGEVKPLSINNYVSQWSSANDATQIDGSSIYTGSITADKITVSDLSALEATIGGFEIDSTSIHTANVAITSNANNSVGLSSSTFSRSINGVTRTNLKFAIGGNFGVDNTGAVYASSGVIGGFAITGTAIHSGTLTEASDGRIGLSTTNFTRTINGQSITTLRLAIGGSFGVTNAGKLYAANAEIMGKISATSGYIGGSSTGFNISSKGLYTDGKSTLNSLDEGVYIGRDGISLGFTNAPDDIPAVRFTRAGAARLNDLSLTKGFLIRTYDSTDEEAFYETACSIRQEVADHGLIYRFNRTEKFYINGHDATNTFSKLYNHAMSLTTQSATGITSNSSYLDRNGSMIITSVAFTCDRAVSGVTIATVPTAYATARAVVCTSNAALFGRAWVTGSDLKVTATAAGTYYGTIVYLTTSA